MADVRVGPAHPDGESAPDERGRDAIYRTVCDSMTCGVMLIDAEGRIETFNPAAGALLGLDRRAVLRRSFAEVFLADEAFEELNDAVVAAMYEGDVGHQRVANVSVDGRTVPLTVDTAYLRQPAGGEPARRGVVAVFSDISELERLRAKEIELAVDLRAKHMELRAAYHSLETRNLELSTLVRKVQGVRVAASVFVLALVAGIGAYLWNEPPTDWFAADPPPARVSAASGRAFTVQPGRIVSTVTVASAIRPRREVVVTSPVEGRVGTVHVKPGERVVAGQPLLELDVTEVRIRRRKAQAAWLKAKARMQTLSNWENSVEVSKAKRSLTKSRLVLEAGNTRLEEIGFLVEQGLTPAAKHKAEQREQRMRRLDLESAEQDLNAVLAKGREEREVARLELASATAELERLDSILRHSRVAAPVAGVVLYLGAGSDQRGADLSTGTSVEPGANLVTIGDMQGVTASGRVDEVDVRHVRPGHAVRISGPAFPGVTLEGRIAHVSSRASRPTGQRRLPSFEIAAVVDTLTAEQREAVRLGMSADMEIVVHDKDDALVVPVRAVGFSAGKRWVRVRDAAGGQRLVEVTTGITTVDAVEILSGLAPGDTVIVP